MGVYYAHNTVAALWQRYLYRYARRAVRSSKFKCLRKRLSSSVPRCNATLTPLG